MYNISSRSGLFYQISLGISAALSQIGFWGGVLLLGEVGPVFLSSPLKTSGTFYLLGGMCFLASLYVLLLIPETKVAFLFCYMQCRYTMSSGGLLA